MWHLLCLVEFSSSSDQSNPMCQWKGAGQAFEGRGGQIWRRDRYCCSSHCTGSPVVTRTETASFFLTSCYCCQCKPQFNNSKSFNIGIACCSYWSCWLWLLVVERSVMGRCHVCDTEKHVQCCIKCIKAIRECFSSTLFHKKTLNTTT